MTPKDTVPVMSWDDMRFLLALVRRGNLRAAAAELNVSHSTAARRVDAMERKLAVRLVDRLPTGYAPTPVGEDVLKVAERVESEMEALERRVFGRDQKLSGRIRASMVDALATNLLMPHLTEFTRMYPEIDLEVEVTYEAVDLDRREADIAFRFVQNPPDHLVGRQLLTCATAAYASRAYLDRHDLQDPSGGRWIGFGNRDRFPRWVKESKFPHIPVRGQFVSLLVQLEACKAGMGVGMLPCFLGEPESSLQRLSPAKLDPHFSLWILTHRDVRGNARIRIFSRFMAAAIESHRFFLEGQGCTCDPDLAQP